MTSDIALSGVACTSGVTPRQLVQSSSENDIGVVVSSVQKTTVFGQKHSSAKDLTFDKDAGEPETRQ